MWNLRITVLNSRMLEEYQIQYSFSLADADCGHHLQHVGVITLLLVSVGHLTVFYIGKLVALLVSLYG